MNSLADTNPPAEFISRKHSFLGVSPSSAASIKSLGRCPLAMLTFALAIIIPNACIAATSAQMQLGMLPGANASVSDLDFRYRLSGDPSIKPLRVYNNSITTTIEFARTPDDKPPTLEIDGVGKYLNSTVKLFKDPDRLIVDGLFDSAVLVYSGTKKGSVTIERLVKTGAISKGVILPPPKPEPVQAQPKVAGLPVNSPTVKASSVPPVRVELKPKVIWTATSGTTLRETIQQWATKEHYTLDWQAPDLDYPIMAPLNFEGSFEVAISSIFALYDKSPRPFLVEGKRKQKWLIVKENLTKTGRAPL